MIVQWVCKSFDALAVAELYALLQLRSEVFVVEQRCAFQDIDNYDQGSFHLMGWKDDLLAAYSRLLPANTKYREVSIGRVVTSPAARNSGLGRQLMQRSVAECYTLFGKGPIRIGAQFHLKTFYESLGFTTSGDIYDEDGIDHIEMLLPL